ncbi:low molecular weight phosphatase family protein [Terriglobus sp. RCC_193]|uniref:arsenate-mycothiol transferase ArsC n=1 Tax=Terriglobus sp. RCC_193 TaxID=3239218 RepID=UPI003524F507
MAGEQHSDGTNLEGNGMKKIIFACLHNAGRAQMAAAFFNEFADPAKAEAISAGTEPGLRVHPEVLSVMQEVGIDLSNSTPRKGDTGTCGRRFSPDHDGLR